MTITIVLVDDHKLVVEALRETLCADADVAVVGEALTGVAAMALVKELAPQVVVLDVGLPDMSGIEVARRLSRMQRRPRVLALSTYLDRHFVNEMLDAGASGYVDKAADLDELRQGIRVVMAGQMYFSRNVSLLLGGTIAAANNHRADAADGSEINGEQAVPFDNGESGNGDASPPKVRARLTTREREVLCQLALGKTSEEAAEALGIVPSTVFVHRRNIKRKLGIGNVGGLIRYAIRNGMVSPN